MRAHWNYKKEASAQRNMLHDAAECNAQAVAVSRGSNDFPPLLVKETEYLHLQLH